MDQGFQFKPREDESSISIFEIPVTNTINGPTFEGVALTQSMNRRWRVRRYNEYVASIFVETFAPVEYVSAIARFAEVCEDLTLNHAYKII
jgi:hypothetical protein